MEENVSGCFFLNTVYSNFVSKIHRFWDIAPLKRNVSWPWNPV